MASPPFFFTVRKKFAPQQQECLDRKAKHTFIKDPPLQSTFSLCCSSLRFMAGKLILVEKVRSVEGKWGEWVRKR